MRLRRGCCCDGPPAIPYTTRKYDTSDGSTLWFANYFQGLKHVNNLIGTPICQKTDEEAGENGIVYVGGILVADEAGETYWNLIAFDYSTGDKLWERNLNADLPGYDEESKYALPYVVRQMNIDPDGNVVCMLLYPYNDEVEDDSDPYFVTVDQDGELVEAKTFTRETDVNDVVAQPFGFTIDGEGKYHIYAKGIDVPTVDVDPDAAYNANRPYSYEWSPDFSSPPDFYDIPDSSGDPLDHVSLSAERFGSSDWLGGTSIWGSGTPPDETPIDICFLRGALEVTSDGAPQEWADFGLTLPPKNNLLPETIDTFDGGLNGSDALVLEETYNYLVLARTAYFWSVIDHTLKLPEASLGRVLMLRPLNSTSGPLSGFALYPPTAGKLVVSRPPNWFQATYGTTTNFEYIPTNLPMLIVDEISVGTFISYSAYRCFGLDGDTWFVEWNGWPIIAYLPYVVGESIYTVGRFGFVYKWNTSGQLQEWHDCDRVQAVADSDGNTYGLGSRGNSVSKCTITKRNADGTFAWAHRHAGTKINYARLIELSADESRLIVTGSLDAILPGVITTGPVLPGYDRDYQSNPCQELDNCPGTCVFEPTNQGEVEIEYIGANTVRITATQNCQIDITLRGGSGGGGGSTGSGSVGGGGGQGGVITPTYHLEAGAFIDIVLGAGGFGGKYDEGDSNGQDGIKSQILNMDGDEIAYADGGHGGLADGTGGAGGGAGGAAGDDGQDGGFPTSVDGGDGGGAGGTYGRGGRWSSYPTTGADATSGSSTTSGIFTVGGGGGARATPLLPMIGDGVGGDGSPGYAVVKITTWDWYQSEETDCAEGCGCWDLSDVYTEYGHPFISSQVLYLNCIDT